MRLRGRRTSEAAAAYHGALQNADSQRNTNVAFARHAVSLNAELRKKFPPGKKVARWQTPTVLIGEVLRPPTFQNQMMVVRRSDKSTTTILWKDTDDYQ